MKKKTKGKRTLYCVCAEAGDECKDCIKNKRLKPDIIINVEQWKKNISDMK